MTKSFITSRQCDIDDYIVTIAASLWCLTLCLPVLVSPAENLGKQFGPRYIVGPDQGPNCLTFQWYS